MSTTTPAHLNSKYAWQQLAQRGLPKRSAQERVSDFLEIYGLLDEETAREQASRCIQCPDPSCVTGCPMCNPIPQWMQLTAEGRFLEASAVLGSVSSLAEICARLCPKERLCEHTCILDGVSEPVAIGAIEQFLMEYAAAHGHTPSATPPTNGLRVAILGSGPGGLACADELAKLGYAVTVFDSGLIPGGLLVNETPAFKVEKSLVQRRVDLLRKRGIVFTLGVELGRELSLQRLRTDYDAVYLALDARIARKPSLPGADLNGVIQAIPFILQTTTPLPLELPRVELSGRRVLVVGGGDTAIDCVRTALRCQPAEVLCSYRRDEASMPCTPHEYENAVEEGGKFLFQTAPIEFVGSNEGLLRSVRLTRTELGVLDDSGRRPFTVKTGTEFEIEADCVILALGFERVGCAGTAELADLAANDWGGLRVDANQMTSVPGVFAGGDLVQGPSLVLHTVRDGRRAAAGIHACLSSPEISR